MIVRIPNPILTNPAKTVTKIDKKILAVIERMKKALTEANNPKGVGLAAPQIGEPYRIFITKPTANSAIEVFINPEIIWKSEELSEIIRENDNKSNLKKERKLEGCLSIPNIWGYLKRHNRVRIKFMDIKGEIVKKEYAGFMATIIQHEIDHLNGILFTQRVLEQQQKLYEIEDDGKGGEKLVEITI